MTRERWRRCVALLLVGQVLAGTLVPMVQAAPIFTSIFEVLSGPFCAPSDDPDAPGKPHRDHAHCILCVAGVGAGTTAPDASVLAVLDPWARLAHVRSDGTLLRSAAHYAKKGCRGPPPAA